MFSLHDQVAWLSHCRRLKGLSHGDIAFVKVHSTIPLARSMFCEGHVTAGPVHNTQGEAGTVLTVHEQPQCCFWQSEMFVNSPAAQLMHGL